VLEAIADLVDLKTPYLAGHSRGVAQLAAEAGRVLGLPDDEITTLRRAGLLHDLGRLGVSNAIWDKPGSLTETELERVRLHPFLTERMLAHIPALATCRQLAAQHEVDKLGVTSRAAATLFATQHGFVDSYRSS
jgi:HD-GYP domain-containing protein (c-di-GMP phosphodiesterase class II)